tara:strand:+ start:61296 stop:62342 length:1047 start_codon:yes stop_codon:yes gene_type:complete
MNYKEVLENLGYRLKDHGSYWRTNAVYRSGDNSTALQIYKDTGVWKDYVEDSSFMPFEALLQKTLNTKDPNAVKHYLKDNGVNIGARIKQKHLLKEEKTYPPNVLQKLLPHHDFYIGKGMSKETLQDFKCGLAMSGKMYQRVIFPIFRKDGRIHGFSGRKVTDDDRPKWLHMGKSSNWFYPYYNIKRVQESILEKQSVHIVESVGDCLSLYNSGVKNVLVSFGLNISPKFISRLSMLPVSKIFISFNNDHSSSVNRGFEGAIKSVFKLVDSIDFDKIYFSPPEKNDFGEMSAEQIEKYSSECYNMKHSDSMDNIISIAKKMNDRGVNKSFSSSFAKLVKKNKFHYAEF